MDAADAELIRAFAQQRSPEVFAALVQRHVDLVYAAARRQLRSPHLAEEAAVATFAALAQNAAKLDPALPVPTWLIAATRRVALQLARREGRRPARDAKPLEAQANASAEWARIAPVLDEALVALEEANTTALLLRYFENKDLREVGRALGTTEIAAQKRVSHALDELHSALRRRGVEVSTAELSANLSAYGVEIAPPALAQAAGAAALAADASVVRVAAGSELPGWACAVLVTVGVLSAGAIGFEAITLWRAHGAVVALRAENTALLTQVRSAEEQRRSAAIAAEARTVPAPRPPVGTNLPPPATPAPKP